MDTVQSEFRSGGIREIAKTVLEVGAITVVGTAAAIGFYHYVWPEVCDLSRNVVYEAIRQMDALCDPNNYF